jgi:uncharacterized protein
VLTTQVAGAALLLLPERAAYLPQQHTLLVADAHIGKAVSFRRLGVPVPGGTTADTLARLSTAVARTGAAQVVFLGDLLHSARSAAVDTFAQVAAWREQHPHLALTLVRGNHDAHAGDPPQAWRVQCVDDPFFLPGLPQLALVHHPQALAGRYVLAGHTHPAALLRGRTPGRLRLPCFHLGPSVGVLPAFGAFTGMHVMPQAAGDRVFVVAGDEVRALTTLPAL